MNKDFLMDISDDISYLSILAERVKYISSNIAGGYFHLGIETHKQNNGLYLLLDYDEARIFSDIICGYSKDMFELIDKINNKISEELKTNKKAPFSTENTEQGT